MTRPPGQASLELTLAMIGALLLLFGSLKVFLWVNHRIIARQRAYEMTRAAAGTQRDVVLWDDPAGHPDNRMNIFSGP